MLCDAGQGAEDFISKAFVEWQRLKAGSLNIGKQVTFRRAGIRERLRRLQGVMNKGFVKYINALAKPRPGLSSGRCSQLISSMRHGDSCKQSRAELFPIRPLHARRQTVVK